MTTDETYLGDGLYCHFDGYQVWLRALRAGGDHHVAMDPHVLHTFLTYLKNQKMIGPSDE